jgi:L-threonylcarbamoyladenylate synthase
VTRPNLKKINPHDLDQTILTYAANILRDGGLIVAPTETRYGLLGRVDSDRALMRLFDAKRRRDNLPTAVFVADIEGIRELAELNATAKKLANKFLPGPLTMVLPSLLPDQEGLVQNGQIGIRVSPSPVVEHLVRLVGQPLSATSANLHGQEQPADIDSIAEQLGNSVALYLDAGPLNNQTTTVVDCTTEPPTIIREGAIAREELERLF